MANATTEHWRRADCNDSNHINTDCSSLKVPLASQNRPNKARVSARHPSVQQRLAIPNRSVSHYITSRQPLYKQSKNARMSYRILIQSRYAADATIRHPKKSSPVTRVSQGRPVCQTLSIRALAFLTWLIPSPSILFSLSMILSRWSDS